MENRTVTACVTLGDEWLGALGPFPVASPWWAAVGPVAAEVRAALGVPVLVLRLVRVDGGDGARGGHAIYHVAALERPATLPRDPAPVDPVQVLGPARHRAAWATEAGVRKALSWAEATLGPMAIGDIEQVKSWNLSGLFRLATADGPRWLKMVPGFSAHEPAAIAAVSAVDPTLVPELIAHTPGMMLLGDAPGIDCGRAEPPLVLAFARRFVAAQQKLAAQPRERTPYAGSPAYESHDHPAAACRRPELQQGFHGVGGFSAGLSAGVADVSGNGLGAVPVRRLAELGDAVAGLLEWVELEVPERAAIELVAEVPEQVRELSGCGLPETLVHGDFHLINWRSSGMVLDFADSYIGHPVLDGFRFGDFQPPGRRAMARAAWAKAWRETLPGCEPERALAVAEPLCHLMYAVRYQEFLDNIEADERCYHEGDVEGEIRAAVRAARGRR